MNNYNEDLKKEAKLVADIIRDQLKENTPKQDQIDELRKDLAAKVKVLIINRDEVKSKYEGEVETQVEETEQAKEDERNAKKIVEKEEKKLQKKEKKKTKIGKAFNKRVVENDDANTAVNEVNQIVQDFDLFLHLLKTNIKSDTIIDNSNKIIDELMKFNILNSSEESKKRFRKIEKTLQKVIELKELAEKSFDEAKELIRRASFTKDPGKAMLLKTADESFENGIKIMNKTFKKLIKPLGQFVVMIKEDQQKAIIKAKKLEKRHLEIIIATTIQSNMLYIADEKAEKAKAKYEQAKQKKKTVKADVKDQIEQDKKTTKEQIEQAKKTTDTLIADIKATILKTLADPLNKEIQDLKDKKAVLEGGEQRLNDKITTLEEEKATLKGEKAALESEKQGLGDEKTTLEGEKQVLTDDLGKESDKVTTLEKEKSALAGENQGLKNEKQRMKDDLDKKIAKLEGDKNTLIGNKHTLIGEKAVLVGDNQRLENKKTELTREKQKVKKDLDKESDEVAALKDDKATLKREKQELINEKTTLGSDKRVLEDDKKVLIKDKNTLQHEKDRLEKDKATLKREKQELKDLLEKAINAGNTKGKNNPAIKPKAPDYKVIEKSRGQGDLDINNFKLIKTSEKRKDLFMELTNKDSGKGKIYPGLGPKTAERLIAYMYWRSNQPSGEQRTDTLKDFIDWKNKGVGVGVEVDGITYNYKSKLSNNYYEVIYNLVIIK